jgi:hypothetical protein
VSLRAHCTNLLAPCLLLALLRLPQDNPLTLPCQVCHPFVSLNTRRVRQPVPFVLESSPFSGLLCSTLSGSRLSPPPYFCLRKEVIQPHLPVQLPCYDFVPVTSPAFGSSFLAVSFPTLGVTSSHDVTGGVYKPRERIQRSMLTCVY